MPYLEIFKLFVQMLRVSTSYAKLVLDDAVLYNRTHNRISVTMDSYRSYFSAYYTIHPDTIEIWGEDSDGLMKLLCGKQFAENIAFIKRSPVKIGKYDAHVFENQGDSGYTRVEYNNVENVYMIYM